MGWQSPSKIVDFLNANPIKYALTINPTIYTSCIEQFWATVKVKTVNGEVQLQALVDGKKIIVTEASVRRDLQLNDEEGTDCLPNATIFEELTRMGYEKLSQKLTFYKAFFSPQWKFLIHTILQCLSAKTTAWNEFSSTMASAIICLATNQKFNFSKYIFESMVKNLDNAGKFLMYPRFVQVFLDKQLEGMQSHKRIYVTPSHTKKIFGNMRRVGKGFSGRDTSLFPTMMVQAQQEQGEGSEVPTDPQHTPIIIKPSTSQPQLKQQSRRPKRKDTEVPQPSGPTDNVADKAVNEEMNDSLVRDATTAIGLNAEQDNGNINKTQSKTTPNEPSSLGTSSGGGPRHQETMGDTIAQTGFENVSKTSNDSLLAGVNTPLSDEDRLKLNELMEFFKELEKKGGSRTNKLKRLYKVGKSARVISSDEASLDDQEDASKHGRKIDDIDKDAEITLVHETQGRYGDEEMFDTGALDALKSAQVQEKANVVKDLSKPITTTPTLITTTAATTITTVNIRPRAKGLVIHEQEQAPTPIVSSQQPSQKDQLKLDEQERIEREKAEANIALKETWDDIHVKIKADCLLAERLQTREQEELTIEERAKLFQQLLEKRRKHFAAKRAEEKRNRPPKKAQQRSIMCTYHKNMEGWKPKDLRPGCK
ncbi:hypothetical protein Tco_1195425 [Tanacetum coccineum]